jgi:hypothetical protein
MKQRMTRRMGSPARLAGHRPRLLIEDDRPALAISDFSVFRDAGFDIAFCSGPGDDPGACPLLRGQRCALVDWSDVVLHGLSPGLGIAAAIRRQRPELPVVVEQARQEDGSADPVPAGCIPLRYPCSVRGQADALLRAEAAARVVVLVHPDRGAFQNDRALVQDGVPGEGVAVDAGIVQDHRMVHPRPAFYPGSRRQD